jgi:glycosyltransferase involved in cell wall biosynthesis
MPGLYGTADIVLDQFRIGNYGVAACEAMAAGRVVVSHVTDATRSTVHALTGLPLPIVEADAATLSAVVSGIAANPGAYREIGESGTEFVQRVHNGAYSACILDEQLHLSQNA